MYRVYYYCCCLLFIATITAAAVFFIYFYYYSFHSRYMHTPPSYLVSALRWRSPIVFFFFTVLVKFTSICIIYRGTCVRVSRTAIKSDLRRVHIIIYNIIILLYCDRSKHCGNIRIPILVCTRYSHEKVRNPRGCPVILISDLPWMGLARFTAADFYTVGDDFVCKTVSGDFTGAHTVW